MSNFKKLTDKADDWTAEVLSSLEGLINHMEVKILIAVFSPPEFKQTIWALFGLFFPPSMLLPGRIDSITMVLNSEQLSYAQFSAKIAVHSYYFWL